MMSELGNLKLVCLIRSIQRFISYICEMCAVKQVRSSTVSPRMCANSSRLICVHVIFVYPAHTLVLLNSVQNQMPLALAYAMFYKSTSLWSIVGWPCFPDSSKWMVLRCFAVYFGRSRSSLVNLFDVPFTLRTKLSKLYSLSSTPREGSYTWLPLLGGPICLMGKYTSPSRDIETSA